MATIVQGNNNEPGLPEVSLPSFSNTPEAPASQEPLKLTITPGSAEAKPVEATTPDLNSTIQEALSNGYTAEELKAYLANSKGMSEDDADLKIVESVKAKVSQAKDVGYSDNDVLNYLISNGYDGKLADSAVQSTNFKDVPNTVDYKSNDLSEEDKAMEISDLYKNVYQKYSTLGKQVQGVFDTRAGIEARREVNQLNYAVSNKLKSEGIDSFIDPDSGEVMMRDKSGVVSEVDSSMIAGITNSKGEFAGAIAGAAAGARGGAIAGAAVGAAFPPAEAISIPVGTIAGGIMGSMAGASAGRGIDLAINAKKLSEDLTAKMYMSQMVEAGIFDGAVSVIGGSAIKLGAKGYKGIIKSYRYLTHGNPNGAFKALKENLNITDDQAKEMIANWEKLNKTKAPGGSFQEQAIGIVSQTGQGAETAVKSAAAQHERVATVVKQSIDARAKGVQRAVDTVADENVGKFVREDLKTYQDDVKAFYDVIKKQGAEAIDGTDFRFDLEKLAIAPVMKNIEKRLSNPIARERFLSYAARIESASSDRTFSGLLELRAAVNDFKYSKTLSTPDLEALNTVINKIDGQIGKAVRQYMPNNGKTWMENFSKAKSEYAKMKQLQENSLFRIVNRPGATEHSIQQALSRYGSDKDVDAEVFNQLVERLSASTRAKVEGAAIRNLVNKNTFGDAANLQAVDFPQLAEDLKGLNINTSEARNLVNVINEIAKVYKNDAVLSGLAGKTQIKQQAILSSSIGGMAQMAFVRSVWNAIYKYAPTHGARNLALISRVSKLLQNPLHARTADEILKEIPKEAQPEMRSLIKELQVEAAKKGPAKPQDFVKMYKQSKSGKLTVSDGALGKGVYLVNKVKNPTAEMNVIGHEVNMSRMATLDTISELVGRHVDIKEVRGIADLQKQLIEQGYLGISVDGKVMLFPESTLGTSIPKTVGKVDKGRTVYRGAPVAETAADLKPRSRKFIYVGDKDSASIYGSVTSKFTVPEGTKVLDLSDEAIQDKVIKDLFGGKLPGGLDKEEAMFQLHEGALGSKHKGLDDKFIKYLKDNGYGGHSFASEEAYLPGVLKDSKGN